MMALEFLEHMRKECSKLFQSLLSPGEKVAEK